MLWTIKPPTDIERMLADQYFNAAMSAWMFPFEVWQMMCVESMRDAFHAWDDALKVAELSMEMLRLAAEQPREAA